MTTHRGHRSNGHDDDNDDGNDGNGNGNSGNGNSGNDGAGFDWNQAEAELHDVIDGEIIASADAQVVELDKRRRHRPDNGPDTDPDDEEDDDPDTDPDNDQDNEPDGGDGTDRESVEVYRPRLGKPVDTDDVVPVGLPRLSGRARKPIIPKWLKTKSELVTVAEWAARDALYIAGYHLMRVPKYSGKTAFYAPVGAARVSGRLIRWASAEEGNWSLRQHAADRNDPQVWLALDKQRQRQSRWRWSLLAVSAFLAAIGALIFIWGPVTPTFRWCVLLAVLPILARFGRPADKPITDRVADGPRYRKLTAELVRRGLTSIGLAPINQAVAKDPSAISFPVDIHRDGPGHLAIIDLPYGVEASQVIARRGKLASALRLPMDQVWPEVERTHTGRLALWVGYQPASAMKQPDWPLLKGGTVDVFAPMPFATDPRLRPCCAEIIARNWLFGGQPGSGKTFALRLLVLACALDPRVELRGYELKGVGDFKPLEPICTEYGNGFDDETIARCAALFDWLYQECLRRSKRIDFYAAKGKAPENKVTPELASLKGSGLHPLVVWVDEVQNLFQHSKYGKTAGEVAEQVIKLGRALGITLLLGTQIPDKDSLPTGITRNVNTRFCLSVMDQTANDMILGTSMYKAGYRATTFEPGIDAGWGIAVGLGKPAAYKSFYVDNATAAQIVERAISYRQAAGTMPTAPAERDIGPTYDLLADVLTVWPAGKDSEWNEALIEALAELRPEVYTGWKSAQLTAALAVHGIDTDQIGRRINGKTKNQRGPSHADLTAAIAERNRKKNAG